MQKSFIKDNKGMLLITMVLILGMVWATIDLVILIRHNHLNYARKMEVINRQYACDSLIIEKLRFIEIDSLKKSVRQYHGK